MFSSNLKKLRLEKDLTKKQVSDYLGITPQAYGNYENGKREPDNQTLISLADFFNVSIDFLVGRTHSQIVKEEENIFFLNTDGLSKDDIEDVKKHVEFLRFKAHDKNSK